MARGAANALLIHFALQERRIFVVLAHHLSVSKIQVGYRHFGYVVVHYFSRKTVVLTYLAAPCVARHTGGEFLPLLLHRH